MMLLLGCEGPENQVAREFEEAEMTLDKTELTLGGAGQSAQVTVTTAEESVDATVDYACKTWLDAKVSGKTVTVTTLEDNPTTEPRTGSVLITAGRNGKTVQENVKITQEGAEAATLTLSAKEVEVAKEADSSVEVSFTSNKTVTAASSADWCAVTVGAGKITIKAVTANEAYTPRHAEVTLTAGSGLISTSDVIHVTQQAPEAPSYILELETSTLSFNAVDGDEKAVGFTTNVSPLTATVAADAASWLSAEIGATEVKVKVLGPNFSLADKTGVVTIAGEGVSADLTVTQKHSVIGMTYGTEGVIFWQDPADASRVKIISAKGEPHVWSAQAKATGATSADADPTANINAVKAMADYATGNYAVKYCEDLGPGWYMPSPSELEDLFTGYNGIPFADATNDVPDKITPYEQLCRQYFDAAMVGIGGVKINTQAGSANGDSIWGCRETSDGAKAYYVRYGKKVNTNASKTGTSRYVRCVKIVTLSN